MCAWYKERQEVSERAWIDAKAELMAAATDAKQFDLRKSVEIIARKEAEYARLELAHHMQEHR